MGLAWSASRDWFGEEDAEAKSFFEGLVLRAWRGREISNLCIHSFVYSPQRYVQNPALESLQMDRGQDVILPSGGHDSEGSRQISRQDDTEL